MVTEMKPYLKLHQESGCVENPTDYLVGTEDYYEVVLRELNKIRRAHGYVGIAVLPRGTAWESYSSCAVGMALYSVLGSRPGAVADAVKGNAILRHYERSFEGQLFPELTLNKQF